MSLGASFVPDAHQETNLQRLVTIFRDPLVYAIEKALESGLPGALHYDCKADQVIYYYKLDPLIDWTLFPVWTGVEEVWIVTGAGTDS